VTSYAERARVARSHRPPRAKPRVARAARRRSTVGGVLWIVTLATLLAGVVAVNVAVLRLNVQLDHTSQQRVRLQDEIAHLESDLSAAGSRTRIERQARETFGLVPADANTTSYLHLPAR
jgi:cell division protein FtsL